MWGHDLITPCVGLVSPITLAILQIIEILHVSHFLNDDRLFNFNEQTMLTDIFISRIFPFFFRM